MTRTTTALFGAILVAGALLRVYWNDVSSYSRADETVYLNYAVHLSNEGVGAFRDMTRTYLDRPDDWRYPPPLRFGHLGTIGLGCELASTCTYRTLAGVSTFFGILALVATFLLVRELMGDSVALAATAVSVTSPLQLALGRRALPDEISCAAFLFALFGIVRAIRGDPRTYVARTVLSVALTTFAIAVKETFLLALPGVVAAIYVLRGKRFEVRDVVLVVAPPLVWYLGFSLLSGSAGALFDVLRAQYAGTQNAPYVEMYNSGPPHRILLDFIAVAPITTAVSLVAFGLLVFDWRTLSPGLRALVLLLGWTFLSTAFAPVKNLRYAVAADGLMRALAAWFVVTRVVPSFGIKWALALGALAMLSELVLFHRVFVAGAVYDPVTAELMRALSMSP